MTAANGEQVDNVKMLIKYKADISLINKAGQTALDIAEANKNKTIIELLKK